METHASTALSASASAGAMAGTIVAVLLISTFLLYAAWFLPAMMIRRRLGKAGFSGPAPSFPLGNLREITAALANREPPFSALGLLGVSSDIRGTVFPHFALWRKAFGKVFVYWLGTEPFVYVADPEFLKSATGGALGRLWGKPDVFRRDRMPMFGRGVLMAEGDVWARHRNIIAAALSATNLNGMVSLLEETTAEMLGEWSKVVAAGHGVVDVERDVSRNGAEIIARASFGVIDDGSGARVFHKLQTMQTMLFGSNRLVGVPLARLLSAHKTYAAWKLGREIDTILLEIIEARRRQHGGGAARGGGWKDLLSLLLAADEETAGVERKLTTRELMDECKTFFFAGHETTALALSWTLLMLAAYPEWQATLREEVREAAGDDGRLDPVALSKLTKMGWVQNEVLRMYPPAPNAQRQALQDVATAAAGGAVVIPRGANMWIDIVAMHHDGALWGEDVHEFRPQRFMHDPIQGGCRHRLGFLPFGFGGRTCVGRNLAAMEYSIVIAMVLRRFALAVAPEYRHDPKIMLTLRPSNGVQLVLTPL